MTASAVIVSGAGRYADPWHPFATTSAAIAACLREAGLEVEVSEQVDARLAALADGPLPELLVVNVGAPETPDPADAATRTGLLAHLAAGRPLLGMHVSSTSFAAMPEWEAILGGIWVRGQTMHPDYGRAHVEVPPSAHPITAGLGDFELDDERYSFMRVDPGVEALAFHEHDGLRHPLLWTHRHGAARVVYDALGHDGASYDSPEHRELVRRSARWLLGA